MTRFVLTLSLLAIGCVGDPVGDSCTPEQVPSGGFASSETYVELSSTQCVSRVCIVRGLSGDPSESCEVDCPTESDVREHVYCSCRCDADAPGGPCACPDGFSCAEVHDASYCVRDSI